MKKKKRSKRDNKKLLEACSEDLSLYEAENRTEELRCSEAERDCFGGDDGEDKNIISRVILF